MLISLVCSLSIDAASDLANVNFCGIVTYDFITSRDCVYVSMYNIYVYYYKAYTKNPTLLFTIKVFKTTHFLNAAIFQYVITPTVYKMPI